ncbi:MAG: TraC family protein [Patescibacteria group bacterium]|jgi:hypothetical protein
MPKQQVMQKKAAPKAPSTQKYLPIAEIKDNIVVMKDGTLRKVLMVSSINFALKNEDEQKAIISGYVQFLNTLEMPLQIVIQSRKLDIKNYLEKLRQLTKTQGNELLKIQTQEYANYIEQLVDLAEIMEKKFFVVVPYSPFSKKQKKSFFSRVSDVLSPGRVIKLREDKFQKYREQVERNAGIVAGGLTSIGLTVAPLDTQSLIELYYQIYNPTRGNQKQLGELTNIRIDPTL